MNEQTLSTPAPQDENSQDEFANLPRELAAKMQSLRANMQAKARVSAATWDDLSARLRAHIGEGDFNHWFAQAKASVTMDTERASALLQLAFPTGFICNWVQAHYADLIGAFWRGIEPGGRVELVVMAAPPPETLPAKIEPEAAPPAKILKFPLPFGEDTRAVSNLLARCALFAAVKERQFFREYVTVGEIGGAKIEFMGEQLNQDDHDTLLQLVKMARDQRLGEDVVQAVNAVLKDLGRKTQESQRRQLFGEISRLVRGDIRITPPNGMRYEGHLLNDATTPPDQAILPRYRRHLAYQLNPKLARFFEADQITLTNWKQRLKLKGRGSELAKWLQFHIESHAEQFSMKVRTIRDRCGSTTKDLKNFRTILRQALDLLKNAGIITAWKIDPRAESEPYGDLVTIERTPSPSQLKHLTPEQEPAPAAPFPERHLKPETIEKFRASWSRLDPYACKADFDAWLEGKTPPRGYDSAFLGFAAKWATGKA